MPPLYSAVNLLSIEHAEAIQELVSHPDIAKATRIPHPYPENGARLFIEMSQMEREAGKSFHHVILSGKTVVGVCGLMNIVAGKHAELGYWIGKPYWRKGFASFAVQMMLPVAFNNLGLQQVYATVLEFNSASMRVLEKNGFNFRRKEPHHSSKWSPDVQLSVFEVTKAEWKNHVNSPFIEQLHTDLKPILERELAAGNEILEASKGWPKEDSILVALKKNFLIDTPISSCNVVYRNINDPHYWKAEYATLHPVHLIICPFE